MTGEQLGERLTAVIRGEAREPVVLDSAFVAELAEAFATDLREFTIAIRVLVDRHAGPTPAFEVRTGTWRIDLAPAAARAVLTGAVTTAAMWLMEIDHLPAGALAAVAALLWSVESVRVDAGEVVLHARLARSAGGGPRTLAELHEALPDDLRAELPPEELADVVERFHRAGLAEWTEQGITLTPPGTRRAVRLRFAEPSYAAVAAQASETTEPTERGGPRVDQRKVFVVHGRDEQVRRAVFEFLRALGLDPQEWEPLVAATGSATPFLNDVVAQGLAPGSAQAVVVLLTPDDVVTLHPSLRAPRDPADETGLALQSRPNVLIELGMALSAYRDRTVIVEFGRLRRIADLDGLNVVRFDGTEVSLAKIAGRLKNAGCAVDDRGADWRLVDRFAGLAADERAPELG
ncbi:nucleotide-binding protein [Saccharothrix sp. NRRL B-16348]|uniref:nucleotide-binding protein n=1 Tax=Saccharothrix sp. NRRL B-16348 TaxID=1415542 RepID=UPI0006AF2721|nr:nucleotide-binding protein [Saccharothrix sp. NRRL B-16348]